MFAAVRGTRLFFDVDGAGLVAEPGAMRERPVAFLVHGGPGGDHSGFKPAMSPLSADIQVVYWDHRGQGRSARGDPARWTLDENVEDMEALRLHLGLGPIVSVGTSYGGMVAMAHAARYPHAVARLVLVVTAAHGGFVPAAERFLAEHGTAEQRRVGARLFGGSFASDAELSEFFAVMGPLYSRRGPGTVPMGKPIHAFEPTNIAFGPGGVLRGFDLRDEIVAIRVPTLVLAGRHDWICPVPFSEEIAGLIPGARLMVFEESGHSVRLDQPAELLAAIRGFVNEGDRV